MHTSTLEKLSPKCCLDEKRKELKPVAPPPFAHPLLFLVFSLFDFFVTVTFLTTTRNKFQLQGQVHLSQINVVVPSLVEFQTLCIFHRAR